MAKSPPEAMTPEELAARRKKVDCPSYKPVLRGYACQSYAGRGACKLPEYFMCVEWLKLNPDLPLPARPVEPSDGGTQPGGTPVTGTNRVLGKIFPKDPAADSQPRRERHKELRVINSPSETLSGSTTKAQREAAVYDLRPLTRTPNAGEQKQHILENPELLTEAAVDALSKTGYETTVDTKSGIQVTLVPTYTTEDRAELSYQDARTLVMVMQVFPGASITGLKKPG